MPGKELLKALRAQPFVPFELVTSSGGRYLVRHPELAKITSEGTIYVFRPSKDPNAEVESPDIVSMLHVTSIEPVDSSRQRRRAS